MVSQIRYCLLEIRKMIGPKMKSRSRTTPLGQHLQKRRVYQPVLVVAAFRPWIRKKNKRPDDAHLFTYLDEEIGAVTLDEIEVLQPRTIAFAYRACDSVTTDVNSHTETIRMGHRVGGQIMPVT